MRSDCQYRVGLAGHVGGRVHQQILFLPYIFIKCIMTQKILKKKDRDRFPF
jgi:hypothetical protein